MGQGVCALLWGLLPVISCRTPLVMADTVGRAAAPLSHPSRRQGWTAVAGTGAGSMRVTMGLSHVQRAWSYELFFDLQA